MINYYDGELIDILPPNLKDDAAVQSISYALKKGTQMLMDYASVCYVYCSIDTMPDEILDYLAIELRTQYYGEDLDIETKRALVRNTLLWYMTAGTPAAVEELVSIVFGYGEVQEWFEYDGEPYTFKIITDTTLNEDNVAYFSEMVRRVKNTRSHLGSISAHREVDLTINAGVGGRATYKPQAVMDGYHIEEETHQTINAGTAASVRYKPAPVLEAIID